MYETVWNRSSRYNAETANRLHIHVLPVLSLKLGLQFPVSLLVDRNRTKLLFAAPLANTFSYMA
jgi:hypothetical protein